MRNNDTNRRHFCNSDASVLMHKAAAATDEAHAAAWMAARDFLLRHGFYSVNVWRTKWERHDGNKAEILRCYSGAAVDFDSPVV